MMTRLHSPAKHFLIALALVFCGSTDSIAQGVVNDGAKINITASTFFIINNGGFTNTIATGAQVTNAGTIDVDGDWVNNNTTGVFGATPTAATGGIVRLDGTTQNIGGTQETRFFNLTVMGTDKKTLNGTGANPGVSTYGVLSLSNQSLRLNSKTLSVENAATAAVTRSGNGFVISETPPSLGYGRLKWNVGLTGTGTYVIPFGTDVATPANLLIDYTITTSGTPSSPYKTFATYGTAFDNSFDETLYPNITAGPYPGTAWDNLPSTVSHLTDDYIQAAHRWVTDRFWIMDEDNIGFGAGGYSVKPLMQYVFRYLDAENAAPNHITEANLVPQRWNHTLNKWGDWLYGVPATITNTGANTVTIQIATNPTVANPNEWLEDMYPVWTLVDNSDPLPIELVRFAGECGDGSIELKWTTWTETNNDFFTVERSNNGTDFEVVDVIEGAGNSNQSITYNAIDNLPYGGTSYYRLKNTDFNGKHEYSEILAVTCGTDGNDFNFVNAYDVDQTEIVVEFTAENNENYTVFLYDASGRRVLDFTGVAADGMNKVRLPAGDLARGIYIINLSNTRRNFSKRVMLN